MSEEIVKFDAPELKGIEPSKAEMIRTTFNPMAKVLAEFEEGYNLIIKDAGSEITQKVVAQAKRMRLDIGQVRIQTGKLKDKQKEYLKLEDKAIMGVHNILVWAVKEKEDKLKEIENHFETKELARLKAIQTKRVNELSPYVEDASEKVLSGMEDDVWDSYLSTKKQDHKAIMDAREKAENERLENEAKKELFETRSKSLLPLSDYCDIDLLTVDTTEREFVDMSFEAKEAKSKAQEVIRLNDQRTKLLAPYWDMLTPEQQTANHGTIDNVVFNDLLESLENQRQEAIEIAEELKVRNTNRDEELRPYIIYIRKYDETLNLEEAEYQEELKNLEIAKNDNEKFLREESNKKAKKEREVEAEAKRESEKRAKALQVQAELNKGDSEKVKDLLKDLELIKTKYSFKSAKNKKMYTDTIGLIDKVIGHVNK